MDEVQAHGTEASGNPVSESGSLPVSPEGADQDDEDSEEPPSNVNIETYMPPGREPYFELWRQLYRRVYAEDPQDDTKQRLTNFVARVVRVVVENDGITEVRRLEIMAKVKGKSWQQFWVPAEEFESMKWVSAHLAPHAMIMPDMREHVKLAIQTLSQDAPEQRVYTHTGWVCLGGYWMYLHAGGALSAPGIHKSVGTRFEGKFRAYRLPTPLQGDQLHDAIRTVLKLLDLAPDHLMVPLLGATFRAVLGEADFSVHISGDTNAHKTGLAALCQAFFGAAWDERNLPETWFSTVNKLEKSTSDTKVALCVIDEFCPAGCAEKDRRDHRSKAARIFYGQGNRSGRGRMNANMTAMPTYFPRGIVLSTGEDLPQGQSQQARLVMLKVQQGDVDTTRLTACQEAARQGVYAGVMAAFIQSLAANYAHISQGVKQYAADHRHLFAASHGRLTDNATHLLTGCDYFLDFARNVEAITEQEYEALRERVLHALQTMLSVQQDHQRIDDPVEAFFENLKAAMTAGEAHVASRTVGSVPEHPRSWGWRAKIEWPPGYGEPEWNPLGKRIGWVEGDDLYLQPKVAYAVAREFARRTASTTLPSLEMLNGILNKRGKLLSTELHVPSHKTYTVRKTVEGKQQRVLHLHVSSLTGEPLEEEVGM
jgi:hypothetical protein